MVLCANKPLELQTKKLVTYTQLDSGKIGYVCSNGTLCDIKANHSPPNLIIIDLIICSLLF